jgi:hypothetical protein
MEERLQTGANKCRKGLFEERSEDTDGDQQMTDQNWRSDASAKWDMIATGKLMQKAAWNRWVTTLQRCKHLSHLHGLRTSSLEKERDSRR